MISAASLSVGATFIKLQDLPYKQFFDGGIHPKDHQGSIVS
jgi:hypothetical protein